MKLRTPHYVSALPATVDTAKVQRTIADPGTPENRDLEQEMNSGFQIQLEKNGGGSTRKSWMESSGLWVQQGIESVSKSSSS